MNMITELSALTSINFSVAIIGIQRSRFFNPILAIHQQVFSVLIRF